MWERWPHSFEDTNLRMFGFVWVLCHKLLGNIPLSQDIQDMRGQNPPCKLEDVLYPKREAMMMMERDQMSKHMGKATRHQAPGV